MNTYIFDNRAEAETAQRFDSLDALYNPRTFHFLTATGIGAGWSCLEVGGGSGSVAAWMAKQVGPTGSVLVTDIEHGNDVGVVAKATHGLSLTMDALAARVIETLGFDQGEGDIPIEQRVMGEIDALLAAFANQPCDLVAAVDEDNGLD